MMCVPISKQRVLELRARLKKKYVCQDGLNMQNDENKHKYGFSLGIKIVRFEVLSLNIFHFLQHSKFNLLLELLPLLKINF